MNLKQNAWMYLFFASVLLWVGTVTFSCEATPTDTTKITDVVKPVPCKITKPDFQLPKDTAINRINRYLTYMEDSLPKAPKKLTKNVIANPDVEYFKLPRCELDKMLEEVGPGADVKAHLALRTDTVEGVQVQQIVLVFGDTLKGTMKWYDFIDPCPTFCKD